MTKPKLVRIDPDVLEAITKLAKENDRSIPKQINRMLRLCIKHPVYTTKKYTKPAYNINIEPVKMKGPYSKG